MSDRMNLFDKVNPLFHIDNEMTANFKIKNVDYFDVYFKWSDWLSYFQPFHHN